MQLSRLLKPFTKVNLTNLFSMRINESVNKTISSNITTYYDTKDISLEKEIHTNMLVQEDFLSENEEMSLFHEVDPYMRRLRYEYDHWDNVSIVYWVLLLLQNNMTGRQLVPFTKMTTQTVIMIDHFRVCQSLEKTCQ